MKNIVGLLLLSFVCSTITVAQSKKKQDIASILEMTGCYEITFNFAETFSPDTGYVFHDNYKSGALEYVHPVVQDKDKIVLQHLLVIGDTMIIKHWRQDWIYENQNLYAYYKDHTWKYKELPSDQVKGQWTQKVYQVDDSPRYEGSGSWVHVDGKHYWESETDAPLPRREYSKRSDYNVTLRRNRHEITTDGWVHEQDNDKIIRSGAGDQLLASEKGMNTYVKTDLESCKVAQEWWDNNQTYWADVRLVWDELFDQKQTIGLSMKVDDKKLYQRLFGLGKEVAVDDDYNSEEVKQKVREIIALHKTKESTQASVSY